VPGLLLVRHAQSEWNASGRWQGWADPPLSAEGEDQARRAGVRLGAAEPFDLLVSSDLRRARRTVEVLAQTLELSAPRWIVDGLREYDVGEWSGLTRPQIEDRWPGRIARFAHHESEPPPGGESRPHFNARVVEAARQIAARAATDGMDRMLIVAHGGVVRALASLVSLPDLPVGHLAGYWGRHTEAGLFPAERVSLLDQVGEQAAADAGEGAVEPVR
jgi:broad specificity phosphatase PhoE